MGCDSRRFHSETIAFTHGLYYGVMVTLWGYTMGLWLHYGVMVTLWGYGYTTPRGLLWLARAQRTFGIFAVGIHNPHGIQVKLIKLNINIKSLRVTLRHRCACIHAQRPLFVMHKDGR